MRGHIAPVPMFTLESLVASRQWLAEQSTSASEPDAIRTETTIDPATQKPGE